MKNNLFSISAHLPFGDTLAEWILERWGHDPLLLSRALVLLPSRRGASGLREAFLRVRSGKPLLLPRILPLGDADEDALIMSPLGPLPEDLPSETFATERLFLLARLVQRHRERVTGKSERMDHALKLASGLATLMDECEREEVPLDGIMGIVPDAFAAHWQATVEFLQILSHHWPEMAKEQGLVSPGAHRSQALEGLTRHWQELPPSFPVIAAGTTGSIPSTARLLAAVLNLPQGYIVLPGLDTHADDIYFEHLDETHPQWGMAHLLRALGCERADVRAIGEPVDTRVRLLSEVMRPADISDAWRNVKRDEVEALGGIRHIACADTQEEAGVIALLLRETLETPAKTAALVTHNRDLARRVAAIMRRFSVTIDDSAGMPLREAPLPVFLSLVLDAASESLAPLPLLGLLKHPFTHAGLERITCLEAARGLELQALRGLRLGGGVAGIRHALMGGRGATDEMIALLDHLDKAFAPLLACLAQKITSLRLLLDTHLACAQVLASDAMWSGPEAEPVMEFIREIRAACARDDLPVEGDAYPSIFAELLAGRVLRPEYGMHPRLKILSPMEARMLSFDRVVLGGLNEGSWPQKPSGDPWFSRPMRAELGLPAPERRIGLAAHDFFMLAAGRKVILTRAGKEGGVPTQASRWLTRLQMLADDLKADEHYAQWLAALDKPASVVPVQPPAPTPPLAARPREISVTQVETWMRDPYALYAALVLRLRALDPLGRDPDGSDFGNGVHKALEHFVRAHPGALPPDALDVLLRFGRDAFAGIFEATGVEILWWPRFVRIAEWMVGQEEGRRRSLARVVSEAKGTLRLGDFLLKGRADRIEEGRDGSLAIIDYKTGGLPLIRDIEGGLSSQLVLLALIARDGDIGARGNPIALEYWQLQGVVDAGKIKPIDPAKIDAHIDTAREGLMRLIARYNDPGFPYRSMPILSRASRYSDYNHLARVKEWG
jgi:ATP-dependent helicase/nuclease subunit B